jgi:CheY-like chemotaxis protein/tetratricopeptide (TPR) repeat protein
MRNKPSPNILLGEDNQSLAEALITLLEKKQLQVSHTRDGAETLLRIINDTPDLLILDLRLPRLHGVELLKKLRQSPKTRELPVIVISGVYKGDQYVQAAKKLGVKHYLEKPFKPSQLLAAVQDELQLKMDQDNAVYVKTLCRLFLLRFSGRLKVRFVRQDHNIDFINGLPVALRPGFKCESFGHYLHERGELSSEELSYFQNDAGHRHEALVQMGCLDYPGLLQGKLAYLSSELIHAGTLAGLQLEQHPFELPDELQVVTVNMPRIIHDIFQQTATEINQRSVSRSLHKYLAPGQGYYDHINFLRLNEAERKLLNALQGQQNLGFLLREHAEGIALIRTLLALNMLQGADQPIQAGNAAEFPLRVLFNANDEEEATVAEERLESFSDLVGTSDVTGTGFISLESAPVQMADPGDLDREVRTLHTQLQGKNHYQVFDLQPGNFSFGKLKDSYFGLTRRFGPETLMQLGGEASEQVQDILATVSTAYNTLSDVVKKERYDEMLNSDKVGLGQQGDDRFQAQVQYQSAKIFLDMEEWDNAEQALQDACNIDPDNGHYLADLAWSIYRNPKNAASRAMQEKARQLLGKALTLEKSAEGFAYKGWMHLDAGQETLAESEFTKALRINSRQRLARQGFRSIQEKQEQDKKGLFRKMFR